MYDLPGMSWARESTPDAAFMQDRRGIIRSADATSSLSPQVFFSASFLELLEQSLAIIFSYERPLVVNRKAADLVLLRRFWKVTDCPCRRSEFLKQGTKLVLCFWWSHGGGQHSSTPPGSPQAAQTFFPHIGAPSYKGGTSFHVESGTRSMINHTRTSR